MVEAQIGKAYDKFNRELKARVESLIRGHDDGAHEKNWGPMWPQMIYDNASSQRPQTPAWLCVPTSGRIFQQRPHFSPLP